MKNYISMALRMRAILMHDAEAMHPFLGNKQADRVHVTGVWKPAADCCVVWSVALAPASQTGKEWLSFRVQPDSCSLRGCQIRSYYIRVPTRSVLSCPLNTQRTCSRITSVSSCFLPLSLLTSAIYENCEPRTKHTCSTFSSVSSIPTCSSMSCSTSRISCGTI